MQLPHSHYAYAALQESKSLLSAGLPCWIGDLNWVIAHLPGQNLVNVHVESMNREELFNLQVDLERSCDRFLQNFIDTSSKCVLLRGRLETVGGSKRVHVTRKLRNYLAMPLIPAHRRALTSIMLSTHGLAVERLRFQERYRAPVPHAWRLCRFCRLEVEDEVHALLKCEGSMELLALRLTFRRDVIDIVGNVPWRIDLLEQLLDLLHDHRLTVRMAKYVYDVLETFTNVPMFIPAPHLYSPLTDA